MQGSEIGGSPFAVAVHLVGSEDAQPSIDAEEDDDESVGMDEEDELSTDQIRATRKVNSIATIEALRLKHLLSHVCGFPCVEWLLCQL
jgi:hypothetical protein